jgi:hypothetical protein
VPCRLGSVVAGVVVGAAVFLTACDGDGNGRAQATDPVAASLCRAAGDAAGGDVAAAGAAFEDVHTGLHELADRLAADEGDGDGRAAAARLLRAKQRVEAHLEAGEAGPSLAADLRALAAAVAEASATRAPAGCR